MGQKDVIATQQDARWMRDQLKGLIMYKEIECGHGSFLFGKEAPTIWGDIVLETLSLMDTDLDSIEAMKSNPDIDEMEIFDKPKAKKQVIQTFAEEQFYRKAEDHLKTHFGETNLNNLKELHSSVMQTQK